MKRNKRHGTGTLVRKGNIWLARWVFAGKLYKRSTGTANRKEAEKRLEEFTADFQRDGEAATLARQTARLGGIREQIRQAEDARPALTIAAMFAAFRDSTRKRHEWGASTLATYQGRYNVFRDWFTENRPAIKEARHVGKGDADEFMRLVSATRSAKTYNEFRAFLSQMWTALAEEIRADGNPWEGITRKTLTAPGAEHERRPLTVEEMARVVSSVAGEMRLLFALGVSTGLRLGDCACLAWADVDLERGFIVTTPRKTARHGTMARIPIAPALAGMLAETPGAARRGDVLPELAAEYRRCPKLVSKRVQRVFTAAGIETHSDATGRMREGVDVGFHSLRHTFVSLAGNAGVPLSIVQRIVGHTKPSMTGRYFHESDAALSGVVAALPDVVTAVDADVPQDAAGTRARALPGPGAASVPAGASGASGGVLDALAALLADMDAGELEEAARIVNAARRAAKRREGGAA